MFGKLCTCGNILGAVMLLLSKIRQTILSLFYLPGGILSLLFTNFFLFYHNVVGSYVIEYTLYIQGANGKKFILKNLVKDQEKN